MSTPVHLENVLKSLGIFPSGMIRFQVTAFSGNASILLHYRPLIGLCILQDCLQERQFLEISKIKHGKKYKAQTLKNYDSVANFNQLNTEKNKLKKLSRKS